MYHRLAVEDIESNHWVAWELDLPGCFSSARTQTEAVARAPECISAYYAWLSSHDRSLPVVTEPIEVEVTETFHSFLSAQYPGYLVNAFFEDDRRPVHYWDSELALRLLQWTRQDLLNAIQSAKQQQTGKPVTGEASDPVDQIIKHVAVAENWYFEHMGLALDQASLPDDPLEMLRVVRANTQMQLPKLIGDGRITRDCDESWSARKVIRRTLWHERDHTQHIAHLLAHP